MNIDSDQDLFCKLTRPTSWALLFASVATLFAITVDRYLYIAKPPKYPLLVTKRRVFRGIASIWLTSCCIFTLYCIHYMKQDTKLRSLPKYLARSLQIWGEIIPISFIFILNFRILSIAQKQRKCILAETLPDGNKLASRQVFTRRLLQTLKVVKTFFTVLMVLTLCCFVLTVAGNVLHICSGPCRQIWYLVFQYELYGINSMDNSSVWLIFY